MSPSPGWDTVRRTQDGGADTVALNMDLSQPWNGKVLSVEAPGVSYVFDPPFAFPVVFDQASHEATGTGKLVAGDTEVPCDVRIRWQIDSFDASVDVPFGTVTGTTHLKIDVWECDPTGDPIPAEAWFHPLHRAVKISMIPGYCEVSLKSAWGK